MLCYVYLRKLFKLLTTLGVAEDCVDIAVLPIQPAWNHNSFRIDIRSLFHPKENRLPYVLEDMFITKLSKYPHFQTIYIYCDGSDNGSRSRCGPFVGDYTSSTHYNDTDVSRCLPAHMSSTRTKLYAILEALHIVVTLCKVINFFVDSQVALYAFQPTSPMGCDLV